MKTKKNRATARFLEFLGMAAPRGLEPPTCGLGNRRSIR
jgi:hypothetical protein